MPRRRDGDHLSVKLEPDLALALLALRAFSSGCTALTGLEAISDGVPAFKPPKPENAAKTMAAMGLIAIVMFSGITALALLSDVHIAERRCDLTGYQGNCQTSPQRTVIAQIAAAVFGGPNSFGFFYIRAATALILILAQDRYLPRQLHTRGDRLAFEGPVTRLIQPYILGVFTSVTLSQFGMVRHWNKLLATERDSKQRRRIHRSRYINAVGGCLTALVLVIVLVTKFTHGAYLVVVAIPLLWLMTRGIRRHYDRLRHELVPSGPGMVLPSRIHAVALISTVHKPALRALAFARASRPDTLTAVTRGNCSGKGRSTTCPCR